MKINTDKDTSVVNTLYVYILRANHARRSILIRFQNFIETFVGVKVKYIGVGMSSPRTMHRLILTARNRTKKGRHDHKIDCRGSTAGRILIS